jgi:aminoglycoside phosphotransferase (APT) family kinase protein
MNEVSYSFTSEPTQRLADPGIPTLQLVLEPGELAKHLSGIVPPEWGSLCDVQIEVLRHHPASRCAVDIKLQTTTGWHELIGKVYAKDRSHVYRAMKQFGQSGFGTYDEFSIPHAVAFLPKLNLLLQERVYGRLVTEIFEQRDEREWAITARKCARWLANFHTQAPRLGPVFVITNELLDDWSGRLTKRAEQLTHKASLLCKLLKTAAPKDRGSMCTCHGDYRHRQLILTKTRTIAFDWDSYCVANPTRDVATFILKLEKLALTAHGSRRVLDVAIDVFRETYTGASSFEVQNHLKFFKAVHCLKHAKRHLKPFSEKVHKAEALLDDGLRILDEEV